MALKKSQKSLKKWTKQKWRTASGKKSSETGEVYAPAKTIKKLKSTAAGRKKLAAANKKKRAATKKGKQHAKHGLHKKKNRTALKDGLYWKAYHMCKIAFFPGNAVKNTQNYWKT